MMHWTDTRRVSAEPDPGLVKSVGVLFCCGAVLQTVMWIGVRNEGKGVKSRWGLAKLRGRQHSLNPAVTLHFHSSRSSDDEPKSVLIYRLFFLTS